VYAVSVPGLGVISYLLIHNSKTYQKKKTKKSMWRDEQTKKKQDKQTNRPTNNSGFRNNRISILV
jgi:predicted histidine transporter YuiF (NhaC family)